MNVSVIIPTLNAGSDLEKLLSKLQQQTIPLKDLIVVDSGSTDQTPILAKEFGARVIGIAPEEFDHGGTRNLAADHASGEVLVYMTQDALPASTDTIQTLVLPLQDKDTVVSYARQKADNSAKLSEKYLRLANYPPGSQCKSLQQVAELGIKTFQSSNVCAAYRRSEFEALGRFPAPVVSNEDMLFAARAIFAGYRVAYTAEAVVWHTHHNGCLNLFKRYFDIAASLDHEPEILSTCKVEAQGVNFFKNQLHFTRDQNRHHEFPLLLLESAAKYLGYKAGKNHTRIPTKLKKHLGLNRAYWINLEENNKDGSKKVSIFKDG